MFNNLSMNTAIATKAGIGILALLLIVLLGNMVVNSTPSSSAKGDYEYKAVSVSEIRGDCDSRVSQCFDTNLTQVASEGWQLAGVTPGVLYFERSK